MKHLICLITVVSLILLYGCGSPSSSDAPKADAHAGHNHAAGEVCTEEEHADHDHAEHDADHADHDHADHDHADHDHADHEDHADHADHEDHADEGHSHTVGPLGGQLAILGSHEFHVELVKTATGAFEAYLYNAELKKIKTDASLLSFVYMSEGKPATVVFSATEEDGKFLPPADAALPNGWNVGVSVMTKINSVPYNQKMSDPE